MKYQIKAAIQNSINLLPSSLSYELYYIFQRRFGGLKCIDPSSRLLAARKIFEIASEMGFSIKAKKILEVGTGRSPILPLSLWLQGADRIVTCDLNPYFKDDIWIDSIGWIKANSCALMEKIPSIIPERLSAVIGSDSFLISGQILRNLHSIGIDYLAPADARFLPFEENYFDAHVSYTVLEHIPPDILYQIFMEAKRVVRSEGVLIHNIDYTDHFAHSDKTISLINFLKFSSNSFAALAGNKFFYMNRLRDDDFRDLWDDLSLIPKFSQKEINDLVLYDLENNFNSLLHQDYRSKSCEDIATTEAWYGIVN